MILFELIWLVPALPLLAALWIALGLIFGWRRGEAAEPATARLAVGAAGLSLLLLLLIDLLAMVQGAPGQVKLGLWLSSGDYQVLISFTLDSFGLCMATLAGLLSLLSISFAVNYLHRERGFHRFFLLMSLFNGAMLLLLTAGNAVLTFIGWELAGVSSYLLIGYAYQRPRAVENATRAFVTNRIGDAGFILAIALCWQWLGGVEWSQIAGGTQTQNAGLIASGFLLAAMTKSAQVPFSPWITRALEGPTPSSALFYGAVMVHAGVYLIIRLEPLLIQAPLIMALVLVIGLLTTLYGYLCGLVQTDVKSALVFSTLAQIGLMFAACGLGWFELAAWHLAAHASWRGYQFLQAPALMHLINRPARPAPALLSRIPRLHTAALQRFWLDHIAEWLLIRPTRSLAQDLQAFDAKLVNRMVGLPSPNSAISSLASWEVRRHESAGEDIGVGHGRGLLGRIMQWIAGLLRWVEEHLVLNRGGAGLKRAIELASVYLLRAEQLLSQPRYLLLLIMATFVVII